MCICSSCTGAGSQLQANLQIRKEADAKPSILSTTVNIFKTYSGKAQQMHTCVPIHIRQDACLNHTSAQTQEHLSSCDKATAQAYRLWQKSFSAAVVFLLFNCFRY